MSGLNSEIDCSNVAYGWLSFQSVQIVRLGSLPFAEDQERLSWLAYRNATFTRLAAGSASPRHRGRHASIGTNPNASRSMNWSSSGTAPNLPCR